MLGKKLKDRTNLSFLLRLMVEYLYAEIVTIVDGPSLHPWALPLFSSSFLRETVRKAFM
jgi:hypothetical protein